MTNRTAALAALHGHLIDFLSRTVDVEIEGEDKPALVADWIGLIYFA